MGKIIVIGGGAAGMMAAIAASEKGHQVILLEKNEKLGKKLFITGKGRCNVTNAADMEALFDNVCTNAKFLYSAFYGFDNQAVMAMVEKAGCPLKIERGDRVFPVSDHSSDVIAAFGRVLKKQGVEIRLNTQVRELIVERGGAADAGVDVRHTGSAKQPGQRAVDAGTDGGRAGDAKQPVQRAADAGVDVRHTGAAKQPGQRAADADGREGIGAQQWVRGVVLQSGQKLYADAVIVCTGGLSYPSTGSTGDGLRFAKDTGHRLAETRPSLVPLETSQDWCRDLMGLSLRNVQLCMVCGKKEYYREQGEMLFTHFGVSGPLALTASCYLGKALGKAGRDPGKPQAEVRLYIDLKPALSEEQLDKRLQRDFGEQKNKQFKNALGGLFPAKLIPVMVMLSDIDGDKRVNEVTKEERKGFARLIKALPLTVVGTRPYAEAIITQGGISVKDVNPSTMESKLVKGLYFAGEVLDLDARTGGFNLQIAWSTGHLAGARAGEK